MSDVHRHGGPECRKLLEQLSEYIDGELDLEACAHIESHMEGCPPCVEFIESLRRTVSLLQRMPRPRISPDLKKELIEAHARRKDDPEP